MNKCTKQYGNICQRREFSHLLIISVSDDEGFVLFFTSDAGEVFFVSIHSCFREKCQKFILYVSLILPVTFIFQQLPMHTCTMYVRYLNWLPISFSFSCSDLNWLPISFSFSCSDQSRLSNGKPSPIAR